MLQWTNQVLLLAGFPQQRLDTSLGKYQGRISTISEMAFRIRVIIGESITSMDIGLIAGGCGAAYAPDIMEDTYAEDSRSSQKSPIDERVSGTVELGLKTRSKTEGGPVEAIMLKPKVVLRSALKNVLS